MASQQKIKVWDPVIRTIHWSLVASVLLNYTLLEEGETLHEWVGYYVLILLAVRLLWGFIGPRNARFQDFFPTPKRLKESLKQLRLGQPHTPDRHNPIGGLMIIALLITLLMTGFSGWLTTLDMFWGEEWVEELHESSADLVMLLALLHITAVSYFSLRGPHNLIRTMLTGYRRDP